MGRDNYDGNLAALNQYLDEQDRLDAQDRWLEAECERIMADDADLLDLVRTMDPQLSVDEALMAQARHNYEQVSDET